GAYYESMKAKSGQSGAVALDGASEDKPQDSSRPQLPAGTVILDPSAFDAEKPPVALPKANLKILLPTGDVFDREINDEETQIGKGPRNDLVIADPSVSTAHSVL